MSNTLPQDYISTATTTALTTAAASATDYKCLVCIFQPGATDSHNMYMPYGSANPNRARYETARAMGVRFENNELDGTAATKLSDTVTINFTATATTGTNTLTSVASLKTVSNSTLSNNSLTNNAMGVFLTGMVITTTNTSVTIPANTTISSISGTTITLSNNITVTGGPLSSVAFTATLTTVYNTTNVVSTTVLPKSNFNWAFHPYLSGFLSEYNANNLAVVRDVGVLNRPTTKTQYTTNPSGLYRPDALFAHNAQQLTWQTALGFRAPKSTGWFGRVTNLIDDIYNPNQKVVSSCISVSGANPQSFAYSPKLNVVYPATTIPGGNARGGNSTRFNTNRDLFYHSSSLSASLPSSPVGFPSLPKNLMHNAFSRVFNNSVISQNDVNRYGGGWLISFTAGATNSSATLTSITISSASSVAGLQVGMKVTSFSSGITIPANTTISAIDDVNFTVTLSAAVTITSGSSYTFLATDATIGDQLEAIFVNAVNRANCTTVKTTDPTIIPTIVSNVSEAYVDRSLINTSFINTMKNVAKVIYSRGTTGFTQRRQLIFSSIGGWDNHTGLRYNHDPLLRSFDIGIKALVDAIKLMGLYDKVTIFTESEFSRTFKSNGTYGTDHAWSGHSFVIGDAVNGGTYGPEPDYTLAGPLDVEAIGRFIPNYSLEQYYGTLLNWFDIPDSLIPLVLPARGLFSPTNIGFMVTSTTPDT